MNIMNTSGKHNKSHHLERSQVAKFFAIVNSGMKNLGLFYFLPNCLMPVLLHMQRACDNEHKLKVKADCF